MIPRTLARLAMRAAAWRIAGTLPAEPRYLVVVAPHASNRDFVVGALAPEGTRRAVPGWRTGFQRTVGIGAPLRASDDAEADVARVRARYHAGMARDPRRFVAAQLPHSPPQAGTG